MDETRSAKAVPPPWRFPVAVEDVPETGTHLTLAADAETRAGVARLAGLRDLPRLDAEFDVTRHGSAGLRVVGRVSATAGQACVVTLEPLVNEIDEPVDVVFRPKVAAEVPDEEESDEPAPEARRDDSEPLVNGTIDLGVLATEFLILGLDPYPRKPDAVFEPPQQDAAAESPFAALAGLTKVRGGG
jgi:hypothetical protein